MLRMGDQWLEKYHNIAEVDTEKLEIETITIRHSLESRRCIYEAN